MKCLVFIIGLGLVASPVFAQCTFQDKLKHTSIKDQYSRSSKQDIKASESAMNKQISEFQKPKYAAYFKGQAKKERATKM